MDRRHVSYNDARTFLDRCCCRPERMRLLCSTKATRQGGDQLLVTVEVSPGGPLVEVRETSMAEGWTGCRFSPSALWLALSLAATQSQHESYETANTRPRALEFGCGVALAGLTAQAVGFDTTLTDCLEGHLQSLSTHVPTTTALSAGDCCKPTLRVCHLDWLEEEGSKTAAGCHIDRGSPENQGGTDTIGSKPAWPRLGKDEECSFDLVFASDAMYEEHHAVLLPAVTARWLRPGGRWVFTFAIRDADMQLHFVEQLQLQGLISLNDGDLSWETACVRESCSVCQGLLAKGAMLMPNNDGSKGSDELIKQLQEVIKGHEGGGLLLKGQRPERNNLIQSTCQNRGNPR
mmetsp:Transcript_100564/g.194179  ORF Transcript_100564/g.194179 Transcript_100564/m.194179 type:complete len:348 (+) Transcript_100564:194-1237(+)